MRLAALIILVYAPPPPEKKAPTHLRALLPCICGKCATGANYFTCAKCKRSTPWCQGTDEQHYGLCDECAVEEYCTHCGRDDTKLAPCSTCGEMLCRDFDCVTAHGPHLCKPE